MCVCVCVCVCVCACVRATVSVSFPLSRASTPRPLPGGGCVASCGHSGAAARRIQTSGTPDPGGGGRRGGVLRARAGGVIALPSQLSPEAAAAAPGPVRQALRSRDPRGAGSSGGGFQDPGWNRVCSRLALRRPLPTLY